MKTKTIRDIADVPGRVAKLMLALDTEPIALPATYAELAERLQWERPKLVATVAHGRKLELVKRAGPKLGGRGRVARFALTAAGRRLLR